MKKLLITMSLVLGIVFMQSAIGQISGTAHDFSGETWNATNSICKVCHTPHHGNTTVAEAPLWNHAITTFVGYDVYASSTLDAGPLSDPDGISKLCLSCHDGTVAVDDYGGGPTTPADFLISTDAGYVGTDLTDDHPISFVYDDGLAGTDGELHTPSDTPSGLPGGGFIAGDMLFSGFLECASCHDVHDNTNGSFLIMNNDNSTLCLTCHDK